MANDKQATASLAAPIQALISAGKAVWGYDEDDLDLLRAEFKRNPDGLKLALSLDPLIKFYLEHRYV